MEHTDDGMTDLSFTRQFSINPCIPFHILRWTILMNNSFCSLTSDRVHRDKEMPFS